MSFTCDVCHLDFGGNPPERLCSKCGESEGWPIRVWPSWKEAPRPLMEWFAQQYAGGGTTEGAFSDSNEVALVPPGVSTYFLGHGFEVVSYELPSGWSVAAVFHS